MAVQERSSNADKSQRRFYDALGELSVGAKAKGKSGSVTLMRAPERGSGFVLGPVSGPGGRFDAV